MGIWKKIYTLLTGICILLSLSACNYYLDSGPIALGCVCETVNDHNIKVIEVQQEAGRIIVMVELDWSEDTFPTSDAIWLNTGENTGNKIICDEVATTELNQYQCLGNKIEGETIALVFSDDKIEKKTNLSNYTMTLMEDGEYKGSGIGYEFSMTE